MSGDSREVWRLWVQHPYGEPVELDVPAPTSLEELRSTLCVESGHGLLTTHPEHSEPFLVERLEQLRSGATVVIHVPRRRIFISVSAAGIRKKAVMWYPGATVKEVEVAIAKAAGFPAGTQVELMDGEAVVVLSTTIPNDTHLEVAAYEVRSCSAGADRARKPAATPAGSTPPPAPSMSPTASMEARLGSKMYSTLSKGSVNGGTGGSVRRGGSPARRGTASSLTSLVGGNPTPTAHQSAPEEHCVHILAGHTGFVCCLCAVGDIIFTGSQDSNIMIWDLNNLQYIGTLPGHRGFVKCLAASYAKKILCSGSQDRTIRVWSLDSFSTVKTLTGHSGGVNAVLIHEGLDVLVSGSEDRALRVWDLTTYQALATIEQAHLGGIFALERFGSPVQIVSGARDRSLKVWDASTWQPVQTLHPPHYDGVTSIAVAGKHGKFYSGSRDRSIKEWDVLALSNTMHTLHVHADWVQTLCMSTSEAILFSGSRDSTVKVWDGELQCQDVLQGHRGPVSALTTVGDRLFSASHDRTVRVWRTEQYG
mmetsp:Transcript_8911/g.19607  ORF Transcript_8911/g.19607 Transcript_8911/m.19607 type:complete len:536 (-) Transcript_8911:97-1704(-)